MIQGRDDNDALTSVMPLDIQKAWDNDNDYINDDDQR